MKAAYLASLAAALLACGLLRAEERKDVRVLYDFEQGGDAKELASQSENLVFDIVQDNGVTGGTNCCRVVGKAGAEYALFELRGAKLKDWERFDYFAMDVFTEREEKLRVAFELWDAGSKNYASRCTYENVETHAGRNTLVWPIHRARRNGKEGREWNELQPQDKIAMNALTKVKIFFTPFKDGGDTVLWIDKLRILQEDALGGKLKLDLPPGAVGLDFGPQGLLVEGFRHVPLADPARGGGKVEEAGKAWPDPLTGDGWESAAGAFRYDVALPDGQYWVWISAGKVLNPETRKLPFVLKVGGEVLCDETLSDAEFFGTKGLFRHLHTPFSQRPHALWLDYVLPVCPEQTVKARATGGKLAIEVSNHRLAALIALPAKDEAAFKKLAEAIAAARIKAFEAPLYFDPHEAPAPAAGDGDYAFWIPQHTREIKPWSGPSADERKTKVLSLGAAPNQRVVARVCVTPFGELGDGAFVASDLKGPGTIPAAQVRTYLQNDRVAGTSVNELVLLPRSTIHFEKGTTRAAWFWLHVPAGAQPGVYKGSLSFTPAQGGARELPIELEVYPFKLAEAVPASFGMYYGPWEFPAGFERRKLLREQLQFMREVGFTATGVGTGRVTGTKGNGGVDVEFDPLLFELANEVGMGRHPGQLMMGSTLGMARAIARRMGFGAKVDQQPGIEFTRAKELKVYYLDAVRQYEAFIAQQGLPVALESVDEPREVPNPWNRNLEQTNAYADWIREACKLPVFVTPMGDVQSGKEYASLAEHHDIVSIHAWEASRKLLARTRELKKTLWFYNSGKDRFSWGFYAWAMNAKGRWEWHWSSDGGPKADGYPNPEEGYTPFTGNAELAMRAPYAEHPGGFLFKSAYLDICEGINDYTYLVTLEEALAKAKDDAAKAKTVADAQAFLAALRKSIPEFPKIKNLSSPDAGALVGAGMDTPAAELTVQWRSKIAELLKDLAK